MTHWMAVAHLHSDFGMIPYPRHAQATQHLDGLYLQLALGHSQYNALF